MTLVIDNYDSFTFNLVQYLGELGAALQVHRNDQVTIEQIEALQPERILISPGPCDPSKAGLSNEIIRRYAARTPILGVCLGHQCIGHVFGAVVDRNDRIMHGKTSPIRHNGQGVFAGLPQPLTATRYHSLVVVRETVPECLEITAETEEGEVMGLRHREHRVFGVQFHPESILSEHGHALLRNFLNT